MDNYEAAMNGVIQACDALKSSRARLRELDAELAELKAK